MGPGKLFGSSLRSFLKRRGQRRRRSPAGPLRASETPQQEAGRSGQRRAAWHGADEGKEAERPSGGETWRMFSHRFMKSVMDLLINAVVVYESFSQVTAPVFLNRSGWNSFRDESSVKTLIIKSVSDPGLHLKNTEGFERKVQVKFQVLKTSRAKVS